MVSEQTGKPEISAIGRNESEPLLRVRDAHANYGKIQALKGVSLEVHPGEIVSLIGANGAGKSTLLKVISGLLPASSGMLHFRGEVLDGKRTEERVRMGIIHVPEGRRIFSRLTVAENISIGAYLRKDRNAERADMERMMDLFPRLKERRHQKAGTLSGGEQQMLAIARGLMGQPKLLLLDEPSMGLAPLMVQEIFRIIGQLQKDLSILLVEQNAAQALSISRRGYVMETGRIVMADDSQKLLASDRIKKIYLGESE